MPDISYTGREGTRYKPARASRYVTLRFASATARSLQKAASRFQLECLYPSVLSQMALETNLAGARAASVVGFQNLQDPKPTIVPRGLPYLLVSSRFLLSMSSCIHLSCVGVCWKLRAQYSQNYTGILLDTFHEGTNTCD